MTPADKQTLHKAAESLLRAAEAAGYHDSETYEIWATLLKRQIEDQRHQVHDMVTRSFFEEMAQKYKMGFELDPEYYNGVNVVMAQTVPPPSARPGSRRTSIPPIHLGETPSPSGLRPSIGSVGDTYDDALGETWLYKNEFIRADSPFRCSPGNLADVELIAATTSAGTASMGSCSACGASRPPKHKPNTTSNWVPANWMVQRTPVAHGPHETRDGSKTR